MDPWRSLVAANKRAAIGLIGLVHLSAGQIRQSQAASPGSGSNQQQYLFTLQSALVGH
jgi:hypothetical protein